MTTTTLALVLGLLLSPAATAHPGHDEVKLLVGQIAGAGERSVAIDYFDAAAMERKTMSLVIDERTKWTLAKKRVERFALVNGQRVDVLIVSEDLPGGLLQTRAVEIKVKKLASAVR
jgi:hypothetical protein